MHVHVPSLKVPKANTADTYQHQALLESKLFGQVCERNLGLHACLYMCAGCRKLNNIWERRCLSYGHWRGYCKSVHQCRRIFIFLFFLLLDMQTFSRSTFSISYLFFLRVSWAWIGHNDFVVFSFFSFNFQCKKKDLLSYHWWWWCSDVCRSCPQRWTSLFVPKFSGLRARLRPKWPENATRKMASGSGPIKIASGTEKIFRALYY